MAAGRRPAAWPRMIVFALNGRVASRVVAAVCVGDVHGTESFKTRPWLPSESSALESYGIFRVLTTRSPQRFEVIYLKFC